MVCTLASLLLFALTRAEIVARMKAPVLTQCEGFVKVYADCPEDLRREYQAPIARFASETVQALARARRERPRLPASGLVIHVGEVRTNDTRVLVRVSTNGTQVTNRLYLPAPGFADLPKFRREIIKAFGRSVLGEELSDDGALALYRASDPRFRIADERQELERWMAGERGRADRKDPEPYLKLMRKVIEPGVASRRDVLIFASRLYLYPPVYGLRFFGTLDHVDFRLAASRAKLDPNVRLMARAKANTIAALGAGRGEMLSLAASLYSRFLLELAVGETETDGLLALLDAADERLVRAYEEAEKREKGGS